MLLAGVKHLLADDFAVGTRVAHHKLGTEARGKHAQRVHEQVEGEAKLHAAGRNMVVCEQLVAGKARAAAAVSSCAYYMCIHDSCGMLFCFTELD